MTSVSAPPVAQRILPEDIVRQLTHLPSAPRVLPKLKRLLTDCNSSIMEIVALIRLDPGIAARVLQMGNSAYYNQGLRCYTVDEAVHKVGYDQIYGLVANAVSSEVLVRPLAAYSIEADELWLSSVACAIAAEELAGSVNIDRDIAYTIGLLHRVGLVAINEWIIRSVPSTRFESRTLPLETTQQERELLGFHNGEAGAALLRLWDFPVVMSEPVRWQFLPGATSAHGQLAALLQAAKWVRTLALAENPYLPTMDPALLRHVGISMAQINRLVRIVRTRIMEISQLLGTGEAAKLTLHFPGGSREIAD